MSKIQNQKVSMAEKVGYGFGSLFRKSGIPDDDDLPDQILYGCVWAGRTIAGTVMLVARIVDAFVDPTVGILSDRTQTKWGKCRSMGIMDGAFPLWCSMYWPFTIRVLKKKDW